FRLLMGSFVAVSVTYIFGTLLTANGNLKLLNIVAATGVVVNVGVNFILIPHWQALGAAYASLSVQIFTALLQFLLAWKIFQLKFTAAFWLRLLVFAAIAVLATYFSRMLPYHWIVNFIIAGIVSLLASFFSGLLRLGELSKLLFARQKM
ncbi:MAG: polysaccharide biosynthesis C-terminal domain-containing protein, partial [Bacteroidales bacterium]|nr:polysaccharide biosynthesis C-terminal domain-containing protein [Bacteroidales bacterium]